MEFDPEEIITYAENEMDRKAIQAYKLAEKPLAEILKTCLKVLNNTATPGWQGQLIDSEKEPLT